METNCTFSSTCTISKLIAALSTGGDIDAQNKPPLISHHVKSILEIVFQIFIFSTTSFLGIGTNVVSIVVYWRQGLKDSITIGFFALSVSDLLLVVCPLVTAICYTGKVLFPSSPIIFPSVHYVSSGWLRSMMYSLSCTITCILAIERCLCLVLPFTVKLIFTRKRTTVIIIGIVLFHVGCFAPIFASHQLRWVRKRSFDGNGTWMLTVWFSAHRKVIEKFNTSLMGIVLPTITQAVVTMCAIIMIHGVRKSTRFRQKAVLSSNKQPGLATVGDEATLGSNTVPVDGSPTPGWKTNSDNQASLPTDKDTHIPSTSSSSRSSRETRLTKTMIFLVIILSACNIPFLMMVYSRILVPDLNLGKAFHNTFSVCYSIVYVLGTLSASANMFVYHYTSSNFRQTFKECFCYAKKKTNKAL